jgi:hypothetical protein
MNSKKAITLLVLLTMLLSMVPVVPVNAIANTTADDHAVEVGDTIEVSGDEVTAGATVSVYWDAVQPWDGEAGLLNSTKAKGDSSWKCEITIPESVIGDHYVWAKDVSTGGTNHDGVPVVVSPSIEFDPNSGLIGDDLDIIGHGFNDTVDIWRIEYWNGAANASLSITPSTPETSDLGKWTASFEIPAGLADGSFNVTAFDEWNASATANFTVGPSITLNKKKGPEGMLLSISGRGFTDGDTIKTTNVTIGNMVSWDMEVTKSDTVAGTKNVFTIECIVPSLGEGKYNVTVFDSLATANATFTIEGKAKATVSPTYGVQGSTVSISGVNFTQVNDADVTVELWNAANDDKVVDIDEFETDADGTFEGTFIIPAQSNGEYTLRVFSKKYEVADNATDFKIGSVIVILSKTEGVSGLKAILTGTGFGNTVDWNATFAGELIIEDGASTDASGNLQVNGEVPTFWVPSEAPGVYTIVVMDEEGTTVEVDFEITDTTFIETDPMVAPNDYNVTIEGMYFSQEAGTSLEFVLWNATDDWEMEVTYNGADVEVDNEDDEGEFTGYWGVPDDETLSLGTYWINCTDGNGLFAMYEFQLVAKTVEIQPRKSVFRIGDTVAFNVESSFAQDDSYIKIWDPSGNLFWKTDAFIPTEWIKVGTIERIPYYEQVAGGNPMVLLDDAPLGVYEWIWYDVDDEELDDGTFTVEAAAADIIGEQVADLANDITDLADQLADVTSEFDDVRDDIADVSAIAQQAVTAANQAAEAVQTVAQTANQANTAAENAATAAEAARDAANSLTTLVYGAIGAALVAALAAIVSLMQISRRIAG